MIINIEDRSTVDRNPYDGTMDDRGVTAFLISSLQNIQAYPVATGCFADYHQCLLVRAFADCLFLATLGRVSGIFLVYGCGDLYEPARAGSPFFIKESFG